MVKELNKSTVFHLEVVVVLQLCQYKFVLSISSLTQLMTGQRITLDNPKVAFPRVSQLNVLLLYLHFRYNNCFMCCCMPITMETEAHII